MFGLFKKKKIQNDVDSVKPHLKKMGYDILPYGIGVAIVELNSGYNSVETASHIAFTTMALDIKEANNNALTLMIILQHAYALLEILKEYKDNGMMNPTQWKIDADAIIGIARITKYQKEWVDKVLSDPIAGKERLAKSRINYNRKPRTEST